MWHHAAALGFSIFLWWFATGAILCLGRCERRTLGWSMAGMSVVALAAMAGLHGIAERSDVAAAFLGFSFALTIWAWHEMSFLFGYVTGPRTIPATPGVSGRERFVQAFMTLAHHELAIAATGVALVALTWDAPNQVGTATFLVLWTMRISAKLNVYFGAPSLTDVFLPPRLAYLKSYFGTDNAGAFFAISVTLSTLALGVLIEMGATAQDPFMVAGITLVGSLLALAVLEHWFLVLPLPDEALWAWALPNGGKVAERGDQSSHLPSARLASEPDYVAYDVETGSAGRAFAPGVLPGHGTERRVLPYAGSASGIEDERRATTSPGMPT